jgi:hypothetical protein
VQLGRGTRVGPYEILSAEGQYATLSSAGGRTYDVSADGKRFLLVKRPANQAAPRIIVVQHWFEELRRLAPIQ